MTELVKRCAIYTRKSFEPPVGQEISSLESQRAICSAYVSSQAHRGWSEIARHYDDSGRTGANTERPALQELLGHVESGLVDVVIVYKLDRLTRTLFDFVRLMDFLERHKVALVSITQNFDTSDSLGRLVLNVLLTFAQFEREILSDRMRDRIRVLKSMGRWVGGNPPLGYDVVKGKLVVNASEAAGVKLLYETFQKTRSTLAGHRALQEIGFRRKVWKSRNGKVWGGGPILLSSIYHILRNPIYVGKIRHKGEVFEGVHQPIVSQASFDEVQAIAESLSIHKPAKLENLLTGLLFDSAGRPMCVRSNEHKSIEYRYYISNASAWARRQGLRRMRADADGLEKLICATLATFFRDRERLRRVLIDHGAHGSMLDHATQAGSFLARYLECQGTVARRALLHGILERVELFPDVVIIQLFTAEVSRALQWDAVGIFQADPGLRLRHTQMFRLEASAAVVRSRKLFALPIKPRITEGIIPNNGLVALLDDAQRAQSLMLDRRDLDVAQLADLFGCRTDRYARLVRLNYLAPDIAVSIRDGSQPPALTRRSLLKANLPLDWGTQRTLLGFPSKPEKFRNPNANKPGVLQTNPSPSSA